MFNTLKNWVVGWFGGNRLNKDSTATPFLGTTTASGAVINADTALKLSAVWACVRLRSQVIASLPLHLYDNQKKVAVNHPLYRILHNSPNRDMTASEFWESMVASLDLWGNAYAFVSKNARTGQVISIEPLNPEFMQVIRDKNGVITYRYQENGKIIYYIDDEILHIKGFSLDGFVGLSPIQYQSQVIGHQTDANNASNHEFKNNLKAGGILTSPKILTGEQRETLRGKLFEFSKPENAGRFLVLEDGMNVGGTGVRINPQDAQLLESRYFGIEEICRIFSVPPQLIYHTDKASSWASSLENMNLGFLMYSLRPILVRIEQTIVKKLLTPAERGKYKPRFSVEGLLRADSQGRTAFYTSALQNGWLTRNEVRELEDLPPLAGGDSLTVQLNLTTLENLGKTS